jgi:N-ethylmaleimide reductase
LPQRIFNDWPLNPLRAEGMYGGGEAGYVDYPVFAG